MEYNDIRRKSKEIQIGDIKIGGNNPIAIQSMVNVSSYGEILTQMYSLQDAGCDIVRMTVPDEESAGILQRIKKSGIKMPIVADIHFDWRMAVLAAKSGADKIRINPGNIGSLENIKAVVSACKERQLPIRVGVNSGSLQKEKLDKYGAVTPQALAESALENVRILNDCDFNDIVVAVKSSSPAYMARANRIIAGKTDLPIHLGVTEAGGGKMGIIKGASGIGGMLCAGIGDTMRVSLTDEPVNEVYAAIDIMKSVGFYSKPFVNIVACPTCGRTKIDLIPIVRELEARTGKLRVRNNITVAVMGCVVNGPGEARDADIGIAGGKGEGMLFRKGQTIGKISEDCFVDSLISEILLIDEEKSRSAAVQNG